MTFEQWWERETENLNPATMPYYEHFKAMAQAAWKAGVNAGYDYGWKDCFEAYRCDEPY